MGVATGAATQRLFVAVDPPTEAMTHLAAAVAELAVSRRNQPGRSTRLAPRERWHITLAFLGDVPVARTERARAALAAALTTVDRPGPLRFAGGGTFGRGSSTVLWAGLGGDVPGLRRVAQAIRAELGRARVPLDGKAFRPHLSLARPGSRLSPDQIAADVAGLESYEGPLWTVDSVHLVASELGPEPRHTRLATVALQS